jgi:hypothetical protein
MVLLKAEQFFDEVRDGQNRRTHIEHKAIGPANIGAAARRIERFNDFCIKAQALQAHGTRYAADPGANDNSFASRHQFQPSPYAALIVRNDNGNTPEIVAG